MPRDISAFPTLFHTLQKKMMMEHDIVLESNDLSKKHFPFLMYLNRQQNGANQQEICDHLGIDKGHTSRTLRDLENKGIVIKKGEGTYKNKFYLTDKGFDITAQIKKKNQAILQRIMETLSPEELDAFEKIIRKIIESI